MPRKNALVMIGTMMVLLAALVEAPVAWSAPQDARQDVNKDQEWVTRVLKVEHADVEQLAEVLRMFGGAVQWSKELGVITWSGPADRLPAVEAAVESLDLPPKAQKNVELTMFILAAEPGEGSAANDQVQETLAGVTTQIRKLFDFRSIRLIESSIIRTRDGESGQLGGGLSLNKSLPSALLEKGTLAAALADAQGSYQLKFGSLEVVSDEVGDTVRLNRLALTVLLPSTYINNDGDEQRTVKKTQLVTDIDVRVGQKVVVGKTSIEGARDTMFLVLTAEVID